MASQGVLRGRPLTATTQRSPYGAGVRRLLLVPAVLLALTACSGGADKPEAPDIQGLQVLSEDPSHDHTDRDETYPAKPPMGGPHWSFWLACGVYTEEVPDEMAVHSQEHGAVWLTYRPGASEADVATLVGLAEIDPDYTLVSPYPGQERAFMASTWGAQVSADRPEDPRLRTFTQTYAAGGQGGEKGADCKGGASLEEARKALAAAD